MGVKLDIFGKLNPVAVPIPSGVVTAMVPNEPGAVTAVMLVAEFTVNELAGILPNLTTVASVKLMPVNVTVVPGAPVSGVYEVIEGPKWVNPLKKPLPPSPDTITLPELPAPTTAVMTVSDTMVKDNAETFPKNTPVAPVNMLPLMVTVVLMLPLTGKND